MQKIKQFRMRNNGGFVCAGQIQYIDQNGNVQMTETAGNIPIGQGEWVDPGSLGVPDGSPIMLCFNIVLGSNRTAGQYYMSDTSSNQYAEYDITGTTLNSHVHFDGVKSS
ncbi:hypothetical protein [Lichenibacterium dinghuense]|uniref:hypothetical protein n=1 Tax=Lichenibacterium dinghuense TaxID=2895977 RepID=UPI001F39579A|nr:hypothetical protein [Lichenibacterium sp. 6Y81]